jgi:hypothetical protein
MQKQKEEEEEEEAEVLAAGTPAQSFFQSLVFMYMDMPML